MADDVTDLPREIPKPPTGLKAPGKRLWNEIWGAYALNQGESAILEAACRGRDRIDTLQRALDKDTLMIPGSTGQMVAHPFIAEIRAQELQVSNLIAKLALPDAETGKGERNQQRDAVTTRWAKRGQSGG